MRVVSTSSANIAAHGSFYMPQRARRVLHKSPGRRRESLLKLYSLARESARGFSEFLAAIWRARARAHTCGISMADQAESSSAGDASSLVDASMIRKRRSLLRAARFPFFLCLSLSFYLYLCLSVFQRIDRSPARKKAQPITRSDGFIGEKKGFGITKK